MKVLIEMTGNINKENNAFDSKKLLVENITFQKYDVPSQNGVIYTEAIVKKAIETQVIPRIKKNNFIGELDHKSVIEASGDMLPIPRLEYASHLITYIELDSQGKAVKGNMRILSTNMGQILKTLLMEGVTVGISLRAVSKQIEKRDGLLIPQDLLLLSYDAVTIPGFGLENVALNKDDIKIVSEVLQYYANKKTASESVETLNNLYHRMLEIFKNGDKL